LLEGSFTSATLTKPLKTAQEIQAELEWAAVQLTRDTSTTRMEFSLPTLATGGQVDDAYNWDVQVSCRPEQDAAAQAAVQHVADKWRLAVSGFDIFVASPMVQRA